MAQHTNLHSALQYLPEYKTRIVHQFIGWKMRGQNYQQS